MKYWLVLIWFLCATMSSYSQSSYAASYVSNGNYNTTTAGIALGKDSTQWSRPKKTTVMAMVVPGSGQIHNKKYWKAGIVYAGFGGLIYSFKLNADSLSKYQAILVNKLNKDSGTVDNYPTLTAAGAASSRDFYRRNRDFTIIGFVALYALQIIDANVDAHLREFDINQNLALHISPDIMTTRPGLGTYTGLTLTLRLR